MKLYALLKLLKNNFLDDIYLNGKRVFWYKDIEILRDGVDYTANDIEDVEIEDLLILPGERFPEENPIVLKITTKQEEE